MGKRSPQRPMKGFSKIVFGDEGEAVAASCPLCGKLACFCVQELGGTAATADAGAGTAATGSSKALPVLNGDA